MTRTARPKILRVSSENQWFQRADVIKRNRKKRQRHGQFLVEGVWSLRQLVANDAWDIEAFLYSRERRLSDWARGVLKNSRARHHLELTDTLMDKLSDKDETSELLAIAQIPPDDPLRIPVRENALMVLVDRPVSPGNLGTLIRSCDALGVHGLVVTGHGVDLFDPRTIRATAGSFFALPVVRIFSHEEVSAWLDTLRRKLPEFQIVGTSAHAEVNVWDYDFARPTLLIVGNETIGISRWYRDLCHISVSIPMMGTTSSLNIACATTAILYEAQRQRSGG